MKEPLRPRTSRRYAGAMPLSDLAAPLTCATAAAGTRQRECGRALISQDMEILELDEQMAAWFPNIVPAERPVCYRSLAVPPRNGPCFRCPTIRALRDGRIREETMQIPLQGEDVTCRIVSSPVTDASGSVVAALEMRKILAPGAAERPAVHARARGASEVATSWSSLESGGCPT